MKEKNKAEIVIVLDQFDRILVRPSSNNFITNMGMLEIAKVLLSNTLRKETPEETPLVVPFKGEI